jgi:hypothetical protein
MDASVAMQATSGLWVPLEKRWEMWGLVNGSGCRCCWSSKHTEANVRCSGAALAHPARAPCCAQKRAGGGKAAPCAQQDAVFRCICVAGNCTLHLGAGATASSSSLEVQSPMVAAEASYSPMPAVDAQQQQQDMVQQCRPKFPAPAGPLSSMDPAGVGPPPPSPVAADSLQQLFGRQQR